MVESLVTTRYESEGTCVSVFVCVCMSVLLTHIGVFSCWTFVAGWGIVRLRSCLRPVLTERAEHADQKHRQPCSKYPTYPHRSWQINAYPHTHSYRRDDKMTFSLLSEIYISLSFRLHGLSVFALIGRNKLILLFLWGVEKS